MAVETVYKNKIENRLFLFCNPITRKSTLHEHEVMKHPCSK